MNKNPQKRYREIGEDNRMVAVIRFYILRSRKCIENEYMRDLLASLSEKL